MVLRLCDLHNLKKLARSTNFISKKLVMIRCIKRMRSLSPLIIPITGTSGEPTTLGVLWDLTNTASVSISRILVYRDIRMVRKTLGKLFETPHTIHTKIYPHLNPLVQIPITEEGVEVGEVLQQHLVSLH
jgi:hypothetical protein